MPTPRAAVAFRFLQEHNAYYKSFLRQHNAIVAAYMVLLLQFVPGYETLRTEQSLSGFKIQQTDTADVKNNDFWKHMTLRDRTRIDGRRAWKVSNAYL